MNKFLHTNFLGIVAFISLLFAASLQPLSAKVSLTTGKVVTIKATDGVNDYYLAVDKVPGTASENMRTVTVSAGSKDNLPNSIYWVAIKDNSGLFFTNFVFNKVLKSDNGWRGILEETDYRLTTESNPTQIYETEGLINPHKVLINNVKIVQSNDDNFTLWDMRIEYVSSSKSWQLNYKPRGSQSDRHLKGLQTKIFDAGFSINVNSSNGVPQVNFKHSGGQMGQNDNLGRQVTHESMLTIYALPDSWVQLNRAVRGGTRYPNGFHRWYNYDTDNWDANFDSQVTRYNDKGEIINVNRLDLRGVWGDKFQNKKGFFVPSNNMPQIAFYKYNEPVRIALENSSYADYIADGDQFVEPTLSYRRIYNIRPASEIAAKLDDALTNNRPLEEYNVSAPAEAVIHLMPRMSWQGDYSSNYFYDKGAPNPANPSVYRDGQPYTPIQIVDDHIIRCQAPALGKTFVYELRAKNGAVIARFNVTGVDRATHGPKNVSQNGEISTRKQLEARGYYREGKLDYNNSVGDILGENPLPWGDTSYGFTYTTGAAGRNKSRRRGFADCGEYALVSDVARIKELDKNFSYRLAPWLDGISTKNHVDSDAPAGTNGYFMYLDLTEDPGLIGTIKIPGGYCPGTSMYISAHLTNLNKLTTGNDNKLNILFSVVGHDKATGREVVLGAYSPGDIDYTGGAWNQILFESVIPKTVDVDKDFFLRVYNASIYVPKVEDKVTNKDYGVYLGIDDIFVYTSNPSSLPIQGMTSCSPDENVNIAILKCDYKDKFTDENDQDIYYKWMDTYSNTDLKINYIGTLSGSEFGKLTVNKGYSNETIKAGKANYPYYESVNKFLDEASRHDFATFTKKDHAFYTIEKVDIKNDKGEVTGQQDVPFLYVAHMSKAFKPYKKYIVYTSINDVNFDNYCGSHAYLEIMPHAQVVIDGNNFLDRRYYTAMSLDPNVHTVAVRSFYAKNDGTRGEVNNTVSDWIHVRDDYGYKDNSNLQTSDIEMAIKHFRTEYPDFSSGSNPEKIPAKKGSFTRPDRLILLHLLNNGLLELKKPNINVIFYKKGEFKAFVAIPLMSQKVATAPEGSSAKPLNAVVCTNPVEIMLSAGFPMSFGKLPLDNLPLDFRTRPCVVRVPECDIDTYQPKLKVNYRVADTYKLSSANMVLFDTDDPEAEKHLNTAVGYTITDPAFDKIADNSVVTLSRNKEGLTMRGGYLYVFHGESSVGDAARLCRPCEVAVVVVPNVVVWDPLRDDIESSNSEHSEFKNWNKDQNWSNAAGVGRGFVPTSKTDVIIKAPVELFKAPSIPDIVVKNVVPKYEYGVDDSEIKAPAEKDKVGSFGTNSVPYICYHYGIGANDYVGNDYAGDANYAEASTCRNIYFQSGAIIGGQHNLTYSKAFVDVPLEVGVASANLVSVPLQAVYSGDFYIPKAGDVAPDEFLINKSDGTSAKVADCDSRYQHQFRQKLFSSDVDIVGVPKNHDFVYQPGSDDIHNSVVMTTADWSVPSNALGTAYPAASARLVNLRTKPDAQPAITAQPFVRFPKEAAQYYYYDSNTDVELSDPKWSSSLPPVEVDRTKAGRLAFDKGMTELKYTATNKVSGDVFLVGNPFVANLDVNKFYLENQNVILDQFYYLSDVGSVDAVFTTSTDIRLAPTGAMFVKAKEKGTSLTVKFTPAMIDNTDFNPGGVLNYHSRVRVMRRAAPMADELIINARADSSAVSRLVFDYGSQYSDGYDASEDISLLTLGAAVTPFSIYTLADDVAVMRAGVSEFKMVPLMFNVADPNRVRQVSLNFENIENSLVDFYLFDAATGEFIDIFEDEVYTLDVKSNQLRYFITDGPTTENEPDVESVIKAFTPQFGQVVVIASEPILAVSAFDISGTPVVFENGINSTSWTCSGLPAGVYLFNVSTEFDNACIKVVVK